MDTSRRWVWVQILECKLCKRQGTLSPVVVTALAGGEFGSGRVLTLRALDLFPEPS